MGRNFSLLLGVLLALCIGAAVAQVPAGCDCTDNPPDDEFTCEQQSDFGKCSEDWMISGNLCEYTCGACTCDDESDDAAPEEPEEVSEDDADADAEAEVDADADEEDAEAEVDAEADEEDAEVDAEADEDAEADVDAEVDEEDAEADEEGPIVTLGDDDDEEVVEEDADEEIAEDEEADEEEAALADDEVEDTEAVGVILPDLAGAEDEETVVEEEEEEPEAVEEEEAVVEEDPAALEEEAVEEEDAAALEEEAVDEEDPAVVVGDEEAVDEEDPAVVVGDEEAVDEEDPAVVVGDEAAAVEEGDPAVVGDEAAVEEDPAVVVGDEDTVAEEDPALVEEEAAAVEEEEAVEDEAAVEEEEDAVEEEAVVEEDEAAVEEDTAEEEDEPTGDEKPLQEFADPNATCGVSLYEALNTGESTGAFATLLAAAGLDTDLGSEKDSYTVFAPTNEAVEDGVGALGISVDDLLSSPKVETIAKYHVVEGLLEPAKLKQPSEIETVGGDPLIGGSVREVEGLGSTAKIIGDPIPICNSLVYVVDEVLLPASDLAGIAPVDIAPAPEDEDAKEALCEEGFDGFFAISEDEDLSILTELLNTFALSTDLADGSMEYTLFAPTNDAFQKAAETLETTVDDMLKDPSTVGILEYHIIDSILTGKDLLKEKSTELKSRNGTDIVMETNAKGTVAELFGVGSSAKVIETDIDKSCTAAVHKVNNVLLPFRAPSSGTGVRGISAPSKAAASSSGSPPASTKAPAGSGGCQVGTQSLFEVLGQIPEIKVFSSIVRQAKLARVFTNKSLKVTVFAPMDFAFGNILPRGKGFFDLVPDLVLAENLVSNHIVGKPLPARLLKDGLKMKTALTKKGKRETLEILEDPLVFPTGLSVEAPESTANITKLDIFACNSVIHLVDAVLLADLETIPSKTVTLAEALETSESYGSLLNPRSEDDEGPTSG